MTNSSNSGEVTTTLITLDHLLPPLCPKPCSYYSWFNQGRIDGVLLSTFTGFFLACYSYLLTSLHRLMLVMFSLSFVII
jgi:hypothetical protein